MNFLKIFFATLFILLIYLIKDIIFVLGIFFFLFTLLFVYLFFNEEFSVLKEGQTRIFKGRFRKIILYILWIFYAKVGLDIFFEPSNPAVESIGGMLSNGDSIPLINEGAKLIYPLSVALIVICLEEKRLWMPRLDPNCFNSNSDNFLPTSILILLPILTTYMFIPLVSLFSFANGVQWMIDLIKSLF